MNRSWERSKGDSTEDPINAAEKVNGWLPLHVAAIAGQLEAVFLLLAAGIPYAIAYSHTTQFSMTTNPG